MVIHSFFKLVQRICQHEFGVGGIPFWRVKVWITDSISLVRSVVSFIASVAQESCLTREASCSSKVRHSGRYMADFSPSGCTSYACSLILVVSRHHFRLRAREVKAVHPEEPEDPED